MNELYKPTSHKSTKEKQIADLKRENKTAEAVEILLNLVQETEASGDGVKIRMQRCEHCASL